ncbi:MAG: hypothetical protein DMF63_14150 [Acidobacteria bacterium]|nr:MAG: hypothetical protein DMF63_14150 [Acidobacteriota bacterium]
MKYTKIPVAAFLLFFVLVSAASAQKTEITISFGEQFFDALLDAVFQYAPPPEILLTKNKSSAARTSLINSFAPTSQCNESVKLLRETNGKRTSVKFRDGRITAPIAFSGNYNPPLIGCIAFAGVAETIVDLEFDEAGQRLLARARVSDVALNGTGGIGGSIVAKMVQGSIDRKINPIEIIKTDKVSFELPLQNSGSDGQLVIHISYNFEKSR